MHCTVSPTEIRYQRDTAVNNTVECMLSGSQMIIIWDERSGRVAVIFFLDTISTREGAIYLAIHEYEML